jgi:hypothetical protein
MLRQGDAENGLQTQGRERGGKEDWYGDSTQGRSLTSAAATMAEPVPSADPEAEGGRVELADQVGATLW